MGKRLLVITPVPEGGAGFRYRIQQYLPFLAAEGIDVCVRPFYSERLFELVLRPHALGKRALLFAERAARRLAQLATLGGFDGVFLYREAFPLGPPWWEWVCAKGWRKPIIFDFDDAIFLGDTSDTNRFLRGLKWPSRVGEILRWSRHVIAGNSFLASYARTYQPAVSVIPSSIDTERFRPRGRNTRETSEPLVIGWIGTPTTAKYLQSLDGVFRQLARQHAFTVKVVGAGYALPMSGVRLDERPWDLAREVEEFATCDIGVYPMWDDAWSRGKCGLKALQFMACGVPVVAARVGMNCEIIEEGANGLLAASDSEWVAALSRLLDDSSLRQRLGQAGRETVEARYSLAVNAPKFVRVINGLWETYGAEEIHADGSMATAADAVPAALAMGARG